MIVKSKEFDIDKVIQKPVFIPETTNLLHQLILLKKIKSIWPLSR